MKGRLRSLVFLLACTVVLRPCPGEDIMIAYTNASWLLPHWRSFLELDTFLSIRGWVEIRSKRTFLVDPSQEYELSGSFRTPPDQQRESRFEFGFQPIDSDRNEISVTSIYHDASSYTRLAAEAKSGSQTVEILAAPGWGGGFIAFNARKDCSDLPNREVLAFHACRTKKQGNRLILTLREPLRRTYPQGTAVRCHNQSQKLWTGNRGAVAGRTWTRFAGRIKGISRDGSSYRHWWPGTTRARIFLLIPEQTVLQFKDVKVTRLSP